MPKRFRLSDMSLDFVSLVAAGDDPGAQVVLAKADPVVKNHGKCTRKGCDKGAMNGATKCEAHHDKSGVYKSTEKDTTSSTLPLSNLQEENPMPDIKKDDLDPEVLAYVEGLETEVTTLAAQVEKAEKDLTEKDERIAKMQPTDPDAAHKEMLSKADPALRAFIEKSEADVKAANEIAKAERDARLDREFISKAETLPMISTDKSALGGLLRRISDALSVEDAATVEKTLRAANEQIAKGNLFASLGQSGQETTISKSVEAKADEIRKAEPTLTRDQAIAKAYDENPDLLQQAMTGQEG